MKKLQVLPLLIGIMIISACAPQATLTPVDVELVTAPTAASQTATEVPPSLAWTDYSNEAFGLSFHYPSAWFGPDEYVAESILRVQIGSDVVYPYGTDRMEQVYTVPNSYYITIQYAKGNQSDVWSDTYTSLQGMQDGESVSTERSKLIRIGDVSVGAFTGIEYISTLSDTAQTEPVYIRQVFLFDENANTLTIMGSPNNVDLADGADWRDVYRMIDEANQDNFHEIVASVTIH